MDDPSSRREAWKNLPTPTLYPVKEVKFDKYTAPQADGHERALAQPQGSTAIVIDNGEETLKDRLRIRPANL
jgi:actin-related protein 5